MTLMGQSTSVPTQSCKDLEAERDRYREALEQIIGTIETSSVTRLAAIKAVGIARSALEGG